MFWYQINPDYFPLLVKIKNLAGSEKNLSFYKLVEQNLNYIIDLGCTGIWLMPLYIRGEYNKKGFGSPYAVKEYELDHVWGTLAELKHLINSVHDKGLKIITEYIPNHMSPDASFVIENENAAYRDENGNVLYDQNWNDTVKLKHKDPIVQKFTQENLLKILGYGFDGFRLDMAHCPFYDIEGKPFIGEWDTLFWYKVLDHEEFKNKILIAEVYADRNKDYEGYGDQIRLMKSHMICYDKKMHDHFAHKLKNYDFSGAIQETIFRELQFQFEAMKVADYDNFHKPIFLRIPTNHDDNPGYKNFGGTNEYILSFAFHALLPGSCMIYNADEYGLSVKLSVTGEDKFDANNSLTESKEIHLLPDEDQNRINTDIRKILSIRNELSILKKNYILPKITDRSGKPSEDIAVICFYEENSEEIILICGNLSHDDHIKWGLIQEFYPTIDQHMDQYTFKDILKIAGIDKEYSVTDIYNQTDYGKRNADEEFWVGLKPLEIQILSIKK